MPFTIKQATTDDVPSIAKIFLSDQTSTFLRLQLGTVDPAVLSEGFEDRLRESIQKPCQVYMIARDNETGETVSFAQWQLPRDETEAVVEQSPEEKARETEEYRKKLLPGMNEALTMEFREKLQILRGNVIGKRRYYMLCNIGTLPCYKRRGAASALTRWPFNNADKERILVYLDTDQDGVARRIYESLGFERIGEAVFDLSQHGGVGIHTHIAMVREPQSSV